MQRHLVHCLLFVCSLCAALTSHAAVVPQAAPNPIVLKPGTQKDDLQVLMATAAERSNRNMRVIGAGLNKNLYVEYDKTEYLTWTVSAPTPASYRVFALVNPNPGEQIRGLNDEKFRVLNETTSRATASVTLSGGWDRIDLGTLLLNAGPNRLRWERNGTASGTISGSVQIKSLELIRDSDYAAYLGRVAAARADTTWLSEAKYGLFFQYGSWGYPNNVGNKKRLEQQAKDFHVPSFVEMVKKSGASYVIWSFSWWGYQPNMPNDAVDAVLGDASTSQRNLIGEIAAALKAQNIRFMLYYHTGTEEDGGFGEYNWWGRQNFPAQFYIRGTGDRSTFFTNWKNVVTEIGNRIGTDLDGFFFDDGIIYYPAKFEELQSIARTGNPNRVISWNSWVMPRLTDFQDVSFGEGHTGATERGSSSCCDGRFVSGPQQGLLQHGMFPLENWDEWGVHLQNQKIPLSTKLTDATLISQVQSANSRGVPLSLTLSMYEDGTVSAGVEKQLAALSNAIHGSNVSATVWTDHNDNWANIRYSGTWLTSNKRNAGDYQDDVRYTQGNGASFTVDFVGSGITIYGPMSSNGGTATVSLDGVAVSTLSEAISGVYSPQQHLLRFSNLAPGPHTVTVTKTGGSYLQLDKVSIAAP